LRPCRERRAEVDEPLPHEQQQQETKRSGPAEQHGAHSPRPTGAPRDHRLGRGPTTARASNRFSLLVLRCAQEHGPSGRMRPCTQASATTPRQARASVDETRTAARRTEMRVLDGAEPHIPRSTPETEQWTTGQQPPPRHRAVGRPNGPHVQASRTRWPSSTTVKPRLIRVVHPLHAGRGRVVDALRVCSAGSLVCAGPGHERSANACARSGMPPKHHRKPLALQSVRT